MSPTQPTRSQSSHSNRGIAMQPNHTQSPLSNQGITMHSSSALTITAAAPADRPSGIRLRTPRPVESGTEPTELRASQVDGVARSEIAWFFERELGGPISAAEAQITAWLSALSPAQQQTLALRYESMDCPAALEERLGGGFALGLSLAAAGHWRPAGRRRDSFERQATHQLEAAVAQHGDKVLRQIERRAEWDFASALHAYARARGRAPSVLPVTAREVP